MTQITIELALQDMPEANTLTELVKQYLKICDLPAYYTKKAVEFDSKTGKPVKFEIIDVYADSLIFGEHYISTLKMTKSLFNSIYEDKFNVIETGNGIKILVNRNCDGSDYGTSITLSNLNTTFVDGC